MPVKRLKIPSAHSFSQAFHKKSQPLRALTGACQNQNQAVNLPSWW
jgi:hypothetical protein